MISEGWQIAAFIVAILAFAGVVTFSVIPRLVRRKHPPTHDMDLSDSRVRAGLTDFLARHRISGDADIRCGVVLASVPLDRLDPLLQLFGTSFNMMIDIPNGINGDLYIAVKRPGQGTGWDYRCSGVGVSDIGEIVQLVQRLRANQEGRDASGAG